MKVPDAVVFDFDGVIVDSETPEYESHRAIFERHGCTLSVEEWCDVIGTSGSDPERWSRLLRERAPTAPDHAAFRREASHLFRERLPREPMPGVGALIDALVRAGVVCAIASNSPTDWVVPASAALGVARHMTAIVTRDDVEQGKPAPDVYVEAARRVGADPRRSIAIEDSESGVTAAYAAGFCTIAVPHWLTARHDLSRADVVLASARDITLPLLGRLLARR